MLEDKVAVGLVRVCAADELKSGQVRLVDIAGHSIGIFNVNGAFYALANRCPHAGGPLCQGQVTGTSYATAPYAISWYRDGEIIRCPWHSWEFEIATGRTLTEPMRSVHTYRTHVMDGIVYVDGGTSNDH